MKMLKFYIWYEKLEAVGQAMNYAHQTGKALGIPLNLETDADLKYWRHLRELVDALVATLRTGNLGDGKIFVQPIEEAIRVRTGEKGTQALY